MRGITDTTATTATMGMDTTAMATDTVVARDTAKLHKSKLHNLNTSLLVMVSKCKGNR